MKKYQNKYRIASARLPSWHYGWDGAYFVTICTKDMFPFLGYIADDRMVLSAAGVLAEKFWYEIPQHSNGVTSSAFVVMPNHIHGILEFDANDCDKEAGASACFQNGGDRIYPVSTADEPTQGERRFRNPGKNTLSTIISCYKAAVSRQANRQNIPFGWQPRFYDHIIRSDKSHNQIADYIAANPQNWKKDKFYRDL